VTYLARPNLTGFSGPFPASTRTWLSFEYVSSAT
jgi:hypothetical protein